MPIRVPTLPYRIASASGLPTAGRCRRPFATLALLAALGAPAAAQSPKPDAGEARRQLEASRHQLDEVQKRSKELAAEVAQIHADREKLNGQLLETARAIQASEAQMTRAEGHIGELQAQEGMVRGSLEKSHGAISSLLAAMQRMGRSPPPVMITKREDALSMVRSAMLLATAFPAMRGQAQALSEKLGELVRVIDENRRESERLRDETQRLADNRLKLTALVEQRRQTLAERQEEQAQLRKAAAEIAHSVTDFTELVAKLDKLEKSVAEKSGLGAYERQLAAAQQGPAATPPIEAATSPPLDATAAPKKGPAKPAEDLRPSITLQPGERLAMASPGRIQPAVPFEQAKGRLLLPAQGRQIQNFGDRTQSGRADGIVIETRAGAQVVSPNDGWITYAGEFRSYGQILIINGGGGYHVLLAGLSQISVQVGDFVLAGEPVGVMFAAPKTASTKTQDTAPVLYVEFRKNQRPVDPAPWWAETARKVAG
jgi:murein hydrolase activator